MKKIFYLLAFGFIGINSLLGQTKEIEVLQKKIKNSLFQNPDSLIFYNHQLLRYSSELSDSLVAQSYKQLGLSFGRKEQIDSANYYFDKSLSTTEGHPLLKGNVYVKWAKTERDFGNYKKAHKILDSAETLFKNQNSQSGIGKVLIERGTIDHYNRQSGKAIEELKEAIKIFEQLAEQENLLIAKQELAGAFLTESKYQFAKDLYAQILPQLKKQEGVNYYFVLVNQGDCYFELGDIEKAKQNYEIAQAYLEQHQFKKYSYYVLAKIARVNKVQGDLQQAKSNFKVSFDGLAKMNSARLKYVTFYYLDLLIGLGEKEAALKVVRLVQDKAIKHKISLNIDNDINFLTQVKETYKINGLFRKALAASEQINVLKDSINDTQKQKLTKEIAAKYQNQYQRKKNKDLLFKNVLLSNTIKKDQTITILLMVLMVILLISGIIIYSINKKKITFHKAHSQLLKQQYTLQRNLSEEIKGQLENKERELVSNAMQFLDQQKQFNTILKNTNDGDISRRVRYQISSLINQQDYWKFFKKRFNEIHPKFITNLEEQFPKLTKTEIDLCILLKIKLNNKEIARLLGVTHESVITKKYRLRKKLNQKEEMLLDQLLAA